MKRTENSILEHFFPVHIILFLKFMSEGTFLI